MINSNVRLSDINNKAIPKRFVTDEQSFFIQSFQKFSVTLINPIVGNTIYSVVANLNPIDPTKPYDIITDDAQISGNSSYTIFFVEKQTLQINVIGESDNIEVSYFITYIPENTLVKQELYNDLIINNNLPTLEELLPCLLYSTNKKDILQRMLLDFKKIVNNKGTKNTIIKFLEFMSFGVDGQFTIFDEYLSRVLNTTTITPNKEIDTKTGDYWAEYNNYTTPTNQYTSKNLPNRIIDVTDLEEFWNKLERAIVLANVYFTLPEQSINRWHLNNSVNIPVFQSITSNNHVNISTNPHTFYKQIHIYMWNLVNSDIYARYLVSNNLVINDTFGNTEVRYYNSPNFPAPTNNELFYVEYEISDNTDISFIPTNEIIHLKSEFASITNLQINKIETENSWIEYTIEEVANPLTKIHQKKIKFENDINIKFLSKKLGVYKITIDIWNGLNARERFKYLLNKTLDVNLIEFDIYTSLEINSEINDLNIDVESTTIVTQETPSYLLSSEDVPVNLYDYYSVTPIQEVVNLHSGKLYNLPKSNTNYILNKLTDMPLGLLDSYINVISFMHPNFMDLKIRIKNPLTNVTENYEYNDPKIYEFLPDILFITTADIYQESANNAPVTFIYITTRVSGVDLTPALFDLVMVSKTNPSVIKSIYTLNDNDELSGEWMWFFQNRKIKPLNYDTVLYHQQSSATDFVNYPTIEPRPPLNTPTLLLKSTFPRLRKLDDVSNKFFKLDDILVCNLPSIYVVDALNIKWSLFNAFTQELIFTTNEKSLKYRISENIIYDIVVEFNIRGTDNYVVRKENKISSFKN